MKILKSDVSLRSGGRIGETTSSRRSIRSCYDWQVDVDEDANPLVKTILVWLCWLRESDRPLATGNVRAVAVHASDGESLLTILTLGDEAFDDLRVLLQSLRLVDVLQCEDPETGLDAVFVPAGSTPASDRLKARPV